MAPAIAGFAPGLFGYALFALLSRALYARGATKAAAASTATGWAVAALTALLLPLPNKVLALSLASALGMTVIGVLLVLAVRRHAGAAALQGLSRATVAGIVAAGLAALAGWGTTAATGHLTGATPGVGGSLVQGMLGGIVLAVVYLAVAYALDSSGLRPMAETLTRRLRRRPREETT